MTTSRHDLMAYSPVNYLVVDWAFQGNKFSRDGLPRPKDVCHPDHRVRKPVNVEVPIPPTIETYDWMRWVPEIIVGIDEPSEEIAADYSRAAAIEFCKYTRALQREVVIPLQKGVTTYPITPVDFENVIGIIGVETEDRACHCRGLNGYLPTGTPFVFDKARSEVHLEGEIRGDYARMLVFASPREDACEYDRFLYDHYRSQIVMKARLEYCKAVHFRDMTLMRYLPKQAEIDMAWLAAKRKALESHSSDSRMPTSWHLLTSDRGYR